MRRFLAAAVALAPLCIVSAAQADETISGGKKGPEVTATSGSVTVSSGGSVNPGTLTPTPAGCATNPAEAGLAVGCPLVSVFVNSTGANVTNNGTIGSSSLTKDGGATGILMQAGASGDIVNNSGITLTDGFTPPTDSNSGYTYGPWSKTLSPQNNYGIRLIAGPTGSEVFTGSINTLLGSAITVDGNNSYGISIEAPLVADTAITEPTVVGTGAGPSRTVAIETNGSISVTGNNAVGVNLAGPVTGDVWIKAPITATGQGAVGVQSSAPITGRLTLGGDISATGYHYTTRPIDSTINGFAHAPFTAKGGLIPNINSETLQGGPAVAIGGSVSGGVLLDVQPTIATSTTTTSNGQTVTITTGNPNAPANDLDLDGINDADQTSGSITAFGSAPALVVAGPNAITLGVVGTTEPASSSVPAGSPTADQLYDFGLILKGAVSANGVFDTFSSTAVQLGGTPGTPSAGQPVTLAGGGLFTSGGVSATAYQAPATAIQANSGVTFGDGTNATAGIFNLGGTIAAVSNSSGVTATSGVQFEQLQRAVAIDIEDGVNAKTTGGDVLTINNVASPYSATNATISAQIAGAYGSSIAILDKSSTSSLNVNNQGQIVAQVDTTPGASPQDESPTAQYTTAGYCTATPSSQGQACSVAIDARNTQGLNILQSQSTIVGMGAPVIQGDVYLPTSTSASSTLNIGAGAVTGTLNLGAGNVNLLVGGNPANPNSGCSATTTCATIAGPIIYTGNNLNIEVFSGGVLADGLGRSALSATPNLNGPLPVNSLTVDTGGTLFAAINPQAGSGYAAQTADLKSGAKLSVSFVNLPTLGSSNVYNVIQAQTLTLEGPIDTSALIHPYMLDVVLGNQAGSNGLSQISGCGANQICVQATAGTPAGANKAQADFYPAAYQNLAQGGDDDLRDLFLGKTTKADFFRDYNQLMPVPAGATLLSLASGERAISRALSDDRPLAEPGESTGWTEEINYYADHSSDNGLGFRTHGVGVASGIERGTPFGALGVSIAFTSGDMKTPDQVGQSDLGATNYEAGLYWRFQQGGWHAWARGSAGYATFNSTRNFIDNPVQSLTQTTTSTLTSTDQTTGKTTTTTTQNFTGTAPLERLATATWTGYTLSGGAGLNWQKYFLRRYFFRPEATVEYFYLNEGGYTEDNASGGVNGIPLIVGGRAGHMLSTSAMMNFGARFGDVTGQGGITAELQFGYRDNIAVDPGFTSIAFVDNPSVKALLAADSLSGGGPVAGFRVMVGGPMGYLALVGDVDDLSAYTEYVLMLRAAYRF